MSNIDESLTEYKTFLLLEKGLSPASIEAYMRDIYEFVAYINTQQKNICDVRSEDIENFLATVYDSGRQRSSQARTLCGVRSFFNYLLLYDKISESPVEIIDSPKISRKIPDVLSLTEVNDIINSIDLSAKYGHRNRAILETLYSCGLRVSELVDLKCSDLFFDDGYIRVIGKGNKQRLVPVSEEMVKQVKIYLAQRSELKIDNKFKDYLFLNSRGKSLTRVMIFTIIKDATIAAGIKKSVSPHTFRHTFATHLINGGADIRVVQDLLGHESILTTEIYSHLDTQHKHQTIDKYHPLSEK